MEIFTTPTKKYYPNGQLAFESRHEGNLIVINEWWSDGSKLRECFRNIKTLSFVGIRKEYRAGILDLEINYNSEGNPDGIQRGYNADGTIACEMFWENGKMVKEIEY